MRLTLALLFLFLGLAGAAAQQQTFIEMHAADHPLRVIVPKEICDQMMMTFNALHEERTATDCSAQAFVAGGKALVGFVITSVPKVSIHGRP